MDKAAKSRLIPFLLAAFCILVWGLSFSVTRGAVRQIPPLTLACLRFFLAGVLLWLVTRKQAVAMRPGDGKWIGALTLSGVTLYFAFENIGLKLTTASHGSLMAGGVVFLDEPLTLNLFIGGALICCGVLLARRG